MGFTIVCNKCENQNKIESGYNEFITGKEIHIEVIEHFGYFHTTVEGIEITCYKCHNEIRLKEMGK